ncbi:MAG TPA: tubulin/FtsZ family protein [Methanocorpusculum sp.]|nr:tubulin/FtsZ family protein [Methanocorpusculum sp.]
MRALLIGIGGAGSRIVNMLTAHDAKSNVSSVCSYIFDADRELLDAMKAVDAKKRFLLSPIMLNGDDFSKGTDFDVGNLSAYIESNVIEVDAVFVCAGLGGRMAEAVPEILHHLNKVFTDPVFTILTLPARSEGVRVSARAAAELEEIRKEANASILFDNETWMVRLEEERAVKIAKELEKEGGDGVVSRQSVKLSIADAADELNELLVRRVELLLRAGEITENGLETAEAVLDAGEVLNTLLNTDIVSIGYAAERIPRNLLGFFNRFRMEKYLLEEGEKRTARIAELAKRAVYEEVSVPCDLTTADKALILITGPSDELSMKGFQTIRRWIDRSIKGLEMRAGDYPVHSTRDVAVIVVLAGIENVPRIAELNEIRSSFEEERGKKYHSADDLFNEEKKSEIRSAEDAEIFEEGEVFSVGSDTELTDTVSLPAATLAGIPEISEPEYTMPEKTVPKAPLEKFSDEDVFEETTWELATNERVDMMSDDAEDDVFEETPVIPKKEYPSKMEESAIFTQEKRPAAETAASAAAPATEDVPLSLEMKETAKKRKTDPQIQLGGAKKKREEVSSSIPLPKRNKQPDMVLAGQADLGMKKVTKDGYDRVTAGSAKRPKETDGPVSLGSGQKPKETEGAVRLGSGQKPREADGAVRLGSGQRPREADGAVRLGSGQKPKEIGNSVRLGSGQKPKEIGNSVRITAVNVPKETEPKLREKNRQAPKDVWGSVRAAQKKREEKEGRAGSSHDMKWI